ncbi:MAG: hypothetical protein KKF50_00620 [Nanoarchaeota archaeon]|nr:hypothetical protein [Nanoarchaeota archaeon]
MGRKKIKAEEEIETEDDEELAEAEEESIDDSSESDFFEEDLREISEEDFEVSDFSIGDIGLATAKAETSWKGSLESSLADEPSNKWVEHKEEREENNFYQGGVDEREKSIGEQVERGSDFYTGGGRGTDLYASDSGNYNAKDESGEFYDPRIGKRADVEGVRPVGDSKLEVTGLQGGFGRGTEKDIRGKRDDKKYNN